ncbi:MAG: amidase family protein, partial [Gaiellaceae bacterium]
ASIRYLLLWNFIGAPSVSFPCGFSDGLPVGLQVAAPPGSDRALVALGSVLEALTRPLETAWQPA